MSTVEERKSSISLEEETNNDSPKSRQDCTTKSPPSIESPIISSTKRRSEMEEAINQLADMRDKRDIELQALKKTIQDCKTKMATLLGEVPSSPRSFLSPCMPCHYELDWHKPAVWKLLGGGVLMLYVLSTNLCYKIVPPFPGLYTFLFFSQMIFHLFLTAIAPIMIRAGSSLGLLKTNAITFYDDHVQQRKNSIAATSTALGIICLKLKRCTYSCGCGSCVQLLITFTLFLAELAAACDKNQPLVNENSKFNYQVTSLILLNLFFTFLS